MNADNFEKQHFEHIGTFKKKFLETVLKVYTTEMAPVEIQH